MNGKLFLFVFLSVCLSVCLGCLTTAQQQQRQQQQQQTERQERVETLATFATGTETTENSTTPYAVTTDIFSPTSPAQNVTSTSSPDHDGFSVKWFFVGVACMFGLVLILVVIVLIVCKVCHRHLSGYTSIGR